LWLRVQGEVMVQRTSREPEGCGWGFIREVMVQRTSREPEGCGWGFIREVMVQWTSRDTSRPQVKWGEQPGLYRHVAPASSTTYSREELCGEPATTVGWQSPGELHSAPLSELVPGRRYYYVFGDEVCSACIPPENPPRNARKPLC
jgi:Purple acid Phosphatase, N-terminal domain